MDSLLSYYRQLQSQEPIAAVILKLCGALAILLIISRLGLLIIHSLFNIWHKKVASKEHSASHAEQIEKMRGSVKKVWRYIVLTLAIPLSILMFNVSLESYSSFQESLLAIPLIGIMIQLMIIILLSYIAIKAGSVGIRAAFERQRQEQTRKSENGFFRRVEIKQSKLRTLETVALSFYKYAIYFTAFLSILTVFKIPTSTVITGAGVLGVAIGFGAQNLVRDIISGAFIMFEDQFDVGDYIEACGVKGLVDGIGLRSTRIKSFDGAMHHIPNGQITIVSNLSRNYRRALVDVGVAYGEQLERVKEVLETLCLEIRSANPWIVDGPSVLGVQELAESDVVFRIIALTEPNEQWRAERILRYQIKNRFDREGIEIPYPHRVIINSSSEEKK